MSAALDRVSVAVGRGLVAGAAATAAMTVSSTAEMKLRGRDPSSAPAQVAAKALGVQPTDEARFGTIAHVAAGVGLGALRGLLDLAGLRGPRAAAAFFAIAWAPDLIGVPAAGAAPPPWRWGPAELAISALHHAVYAGAAEAVFRALDQGNP